MGRVVVCYRRSHRVVFAWNMWEEEANNTLGYHSMLYPFLYYLGMSIPSTVLHSRPNGAEPRVHGCGYMSYSILEVVPVRRVFVNFINLPVDVVKDKHFDFMFLFLSHTIKITSAVPWSRPLVHHKSDTAVCRCRCTHGCIDGEYYERARYRAAAASIHDIRIIYYRPGVSSKTRLARV